MIEGKKLERFQGRGWDDSREEVGMIQGKRLG